MTLASPPSLPLISCPHIASIFGQLFLTFRTEVRWNLKVLISLIAEDNEHFLAVSSLCVLFFLYVKYSTEAGCYSLWGNIGILVLLVYFWSEDVQTWNKVKKKFVIIRNNNFLIGSLLPTPNFSMLLDKLVKELYCLKELILLCSRTLRSHALG